MILHSPASDPKMRDAERDDACRFGRDAVKRR